MNKIANRAVMCEVLKEAAAKDKDVVVLCSDSRGSASLTSFAEAYPEQFVEVGIAEQNLVSIAAGRVSYGALGMTHHSAQDIAAMSAIPGMRVYLPSDRHQTRKLFEALLQDTQTAYIRLGRNPVEDVYEENNVPFEMDRATVLSEGTDVLLVACGEMVKPIQDAVKLLGEQGVSAGALDMYCVKPLDKGGLLHAAKGKKLIVTVEEHAPFGGLGAAVCQVICENDPKKVICLALPDSPVITGTSQEVFSYYGLTGQGITQTVLNHLKG